MLPLAQGPQEYLPVGNICLRRTILAVMRLLLLGPYNLEVALSGLAPGISPLGSRYLLLHVQLLDFSTSILPR